MYSHRLDSPTLPSLPKFSHLIGFAFENDNISCTFPNIQPFLIAHAVALRTLVINSDLERSLETPLSINNLRNLRLSLTIYSAHSVRLLLENGQQLESLQLEISSEGCILSSMLRSFSKPCSFPLLRKFSFILEEADRVDPDLFPAVAEIVRGHPMLEALRMACNESAYDPGSFGYDTAIWGVVPSLVHLRALSMDFPEDLPSGLCGWLVPRTVVALALKLRSSTGINRNVSISQIVWVWESDTINTHHYVDVGTYSAFAYRAQGPCASKVGRFGQQYESPPSSPLGILFRSVTVSDHLSHRWGIHRPGCETGELLLRRFASAVRL
jgi:hypothetical protein